MRRAIALCLSVFGLLMAAPASAQVVINEIRIDHPGADVEEYFELAGPPGTLLDGMWYVVLGDNPGSGAVEYALQLDGNEIPASGFFVVATPTFTLGTADLVTSITFENSDNVTHMLVTGFTGAVGDDLDTDDDGVLDSTPWTAQLDLIAVIEEDNPPVDTEFHYGPPTIGPDLQSGPPGFSPSHITRCPDITGTWFIQDFGLIGNDTPGAANFCPDCRPPLTVDCDSDCIADSVTLNWTNDDTYTDIEILRNGAVIATIAGTDTTYVDMSPPSGLHTYAVRGICDAMAMLFGETECTVLHAPYGGESNIVFMGETTDGITPSAETIAALLGPVLGFTTILIDDLGCLSGVPLPSGSNLWICCGTFPADYELTQADGQLLADYLAAGVNIYYEGADVFVYNEPTPFSDYDGVDNSIFNPGVSTDPLDGDDSLTSVTGSDFAGLSLSSFVGIGYVQDNLAGPDYNDQIVPTGTDPGTPVDLAGCEAGLIWRNNPDLLPDPMVTETDYGIGVFYRTEAPFGNVISTSWEFGGFDGDQEDLIERYLAALADTTAPQPCGPSGDPEFRRGDSNADGNFDISDAVYSLAALFTPGAPSPSCADAGDANDDGGYDISDAVYTLASLFTPGAPLPGAPHPTCGVDPTADTLDCASYPCP